VTRGLVGGFLGLGAVWLFCLVGVARVISGYGSTVMLGSLWLFCLVGGWRGAVLFCGGTAGVGTSAKRAFGGTWHVGSADTRRLVGDLSQFVRWVNATDFLNAACEVNNLRLTKSLRATC
jgi:hypothetical protein